MTNPPPPGYLLDAPLPQSQWEPPQPTGPQSPYSATPLRITVRPWGVQDPPQEPPPIKVYSRDGQPQKPLEPLGAIYGRFNVPPETPPPILDAPLPQSQSEPLQPTGSSQFPPPGVEDSPKEQPQKPLEPLRTIYDDEFDRLTAAEWLKRRLAKEVEPFTSYPETYTQMKREALDTMNEGLHQMQGGTNRDVAVGVVKAGLGGVGYVSSPFNAALRTIAGKPIEKNFGIPKEYTEFTLGLVTPTKSVPPNLKFLPKIAPTLVGVDLPRVIASGSPFVQNLARRLARSPGGYPIIDGIKKSVEQTGAAVGSAAKMTGGKPNAASAAAERLLQKVLEPSMKGGEGIPDAILRLAATDIWTLATARASIPREVWRDIAATAVSRLGFKVDEFTPAKFISDYAALSDHGKAILFGGIGARDVIPYLDDIAKVSQKFVQAEKLVKTTAVDGYKGAYPLLGGVGIAVHPVAALTAVAGMHGTARVLATPTTASATARWMHAYHSLATNPTPHAMAAFKVTSMNLANAINALGQPGISQRITSADLFKAAQGPAPFAGEE